MTKQVTTTPQALDFAPHTTEAEKVLDALSVSPEDGLSEQEVARRLEVYGPNRIKPPPKPSLFKIFVRQIANAMTFILSGCLHV